MGAHPIEQQHTTMRVSLLPIWLVLATLAESVRFGAGTACVGSGGTILGEVSCGAAPTKLIIGASVAVAQVSRAAAGEYIEACEKRYGEDRVHQVGRHIHDSAVRNFVAYTVDEGPEQVPLDSLDRVQRYRKPPPPPPPPPKKTNAADAKCTAGSVLLALAAIIICVV
jgi:hypothetical protein